MNPLIETSIENSPQTSARQPIKIALRFSAGDGDEKKTTHSSIEKILKSVGFRDHELRAIYYGNWLRDYSQLLDPKIVRAWHSPKNFPDVLSRDALTRIVDVLAVREFHDLMKIDRERFRVTPQRLGVYRPSEHIDNPKVIDPDPANPQSRDADFEPWVLPGDPLLKVDQQTSMKRYIDRSASAMKTEFDTAAREGLESTDGLRAFGSALHVLEDFFSHSNFVELSLIKLGYTKVLPWTSKADCRHGLPLVTGMFGSTDVIASLAAPLGKILFSTKDTVFMPIQSGERYEKDQIIQILLSEHPNESYLKAFEEFLGARDKWADLPFSEFIEQINHFIGKPGQIFSNAIGFAMQGLMTVVGNSIGGAQTRWDDPNTNGSTDPSHSQLAKDHAEHPLHELAAILAQQAVEHVGHVMLEQWLDKPGSGNAGLVARGYFEHPMDCRWQDEFVAQWATKNPHLVRRAESKSDLDRIAQQARDASLRQLENLKRDGSSFLETFLSEDNLLLQLWKRTPIGWYLTRQR